MCTGWTGLPGVPTCTMFRGTAVPRAVLPSSATKNIPGKVDSTRGFLGEMPTVMKGAGGSQNNWGAGWGAGGRTGRVANVGMEATGFTVMFCPSEVAVKIKETVDEGGRGTGGGPPGPGSQWKSGEVMGRGALSFPTSERLFRNPWQKTHQCLALFPEMDQFDLVWTIIPVMMLTGNKPPSMRASF